jgi:hypothetical protein
VPCGQRPRGSQPSAREQPCTPPCGPSRRLQACISAGVIC